MLRFGKLLRFGSCCDVRHFLATWVLRCGFVAFATPV